jgi:hypothetical protein
MHELLGNAANAATQKRLECRRSPTKRLTLSDRTQGRLVITTNTFLTQGAGCLKLD